MAGGPALWACKGTGTAAAAVVARRAVPAGAAQPNPAPHRWLCACLPNQALTLSPCLRALLQLYAEAMPKFHAWLLAGMDGQLRDALLSLQVMHSAYSAALPCCTGLGQEQQAALGPRPRLPRAARVVLLQAGQAAQDALFPYFAQFVLEQYTDDIKAYRWGPASERWLLCRAQRAAN